MSQPNMNNNSQYSNLVINLSVNSPVINQISAGVQPSANLDSSSLNSSRWLRSRLPSHFTKNSDSIESVTNQESSIAGSNHSQLKSVAQSHSNYLTPNRKQSKLAKNGSSLSSLSIRAQQNNNSGSQYESIVSVKGSIPSKSESDPSLSSPENHE